MRIAQVSPLYESVPPGLYGGTERVVSYLTEELVRQGHDVTLFASGDSTTSAELIPCSAHSLRTDPNCIDPIAHHCVMLERVFSMASEFDLIHFHIDYLHFPISRRIGVKQLSTLHGRLDLADFVPLYREFTEMPLVSISNAQRKPVEAATWLGTVYHGLPEDLFSFHEGPGNYLAFLGRISPEKRVDRAIEIATRVGMPLKIAAKVDKADRDYFNNSIKPLLDNPLVEFINEIGGREKEEFLGNAYALLFPIDWPEPFGLVMIEALACGTPVIAWRNGSVPEVIEDGVSGYIVNGPDEAAWAVENLENFDRYQCRLAFEERFTVGRMAADYVSLYQQLMEAQFRIELGAKEALANRSQANRLIGNSPRSETYWRMNSDPGAG